MKVLVTFVPPGGGEADYSLEMEMPTVPQAGDYVSISRPGQMGTEDFIVKRTWWSLEFDDNVGCGSVKETNVECEFAVGLVSSEDHKNACDNYRARTGKLLEFDNSMY